MKRVYVTYMVGIDIAQDVRQTRTHKVRGVKVNRIERAYIARNPLLEQASCRRV